MTLATLTFFEISVSVSVTLGMANQPINIERTQKICKFMSKYYENECVYKTSMCSGPTIDHTYCILSLIKTNEAKDFI